jgi:hypothetical protein
MTPLVPTRGPGRRRLAARTGVLGLAVLASTALGAGAAGAEEPVTIPLDPTDVAIVLEAVENFGTAAAPAEDPGPVPVAWGGAVVLQLPDGLDATTLGARLELGPEVGGSPTRVLSTATPGPDGLLASRVAPGRFTIAVPPLDPANGPIGALLVSGVTSEDGFPVHPDTYFLELDPTAPATAELHPQVTVVADQSCDPTAAVHCAGTTVTAGTPFRVTVPPGSELWTLGHGTLQDAEVTLVDLTGAHDAPLPLSGDPARYATAGPWDATVTLPAELGPGRHYLSVLLGDPASGGPVTVATVELQVLAAPAVVPPAAAPAPTTPAAVVNVGLRSDTGVEAAEAGATRTGALATGAGLLVLAGVGAVVLRTRRDPGVDD